MASPDCHRPRLSRGRLLLPRLFRLRAELLAPALPAAGRPGRVPRVAVHADHLEEEPLLRLREPRHRRVEWPFPYQAFENHARGREGPRFGSNSEIAFYTRGR